MEKHRDNIGTTGGVSPAGYFLVGCHRPWFTVLNHRLDDALMELGRDLAGNPVDNQENFPDGDLIFKNTDVVFEVPNALPFWGTTYILGGVARNKALSQEKFSFLPHGETEFSENPLLTALKSGAIQDDSGKRFTLANLPRPILLSIAQTCRDPAILTTLCEYCCKIVRDSDGQPSGLLFSRNSSGRVRPAITDFDLFETLGNNPALPDHYKRIMLLNPGVQGENPIVGEYFHKDSVHIWEYLRSNSYIPWGHYAANMAQDSVRYVARDLDLQDIRGLRHLYYQRIYSQLAVTQGQELYKRGLFTPDELDRLRLRCLEFIRSGDSSLEGGPNFSATLWGWNYGYDFAPSGVRLHASHQQIHQQFALIPDGVELLQNKTGFIQSYCIGDQVQAFVQNYRATHGVEFFSALFAAIGSNERLDGDRSLPGGLVIFEDDNIILLAPKAQRSQGEVQIICKNGVGNILEADTMVRESIDRGIFMAIRGLSALGARMVTCYEVSARFRRAEEQCMIYCFLPRHPDSPGAFSERQGRWITGHFPEDYASDFRDVLEEEGVME